MQALGSFLLVAIGGAFGSAARYGCALLLEGRLVDWPLGTLGANLLGCFVIGVINGLTQDLDLPLISKEGRLLLATGFCGGLTTLSSFINELGGLTRDGRFGTAGLYFALTLGGATLAFVLGLFLARVIREILR